jgi:hypothetical protein
MFRFVNNFRFIHGELILSVSLGRNWGATAAQPLPLVRRAARILDPQVGPVKQPAGGPAPREFREILPGSRWSSAAGG